MRHVHHPLVRAGSALVVAGLLALGACGGDGDATGDRQAEVADRGAEVMPFDLDATTHRFAPVDEGLVQTVVADDPDDTDQVALVREHLRGEADAFAAGDFDDPATIHGDDMPGLAALRDGHDRIEVTYDEVPDGARITYASDDPGLVTALHDWAGAQVSDHGEHAEHAENDDGDHGDRRGSAVAPAGWGALSGAGGARPRRARPGAGWWPCRPAPRG